MPKYSGAKGYVGVSTAVVGINQWALDYTVEMLETTDFSVSGVAAFIPGVSRASGTFSGFKDGAPQALGTATTVNLWLIESASEATGSASFEGRAWRGTAYIAGSHPTTNFDGIVSYAYDYQFTGAITVPSA